MEQLLPTAFDTLKSLPFASSAEDAFMRQNAAEARSLGVLHVTCLGTCSLLRTAATYVSESHGRWIRRMMPGELAEFGAH